MKLPPREKRIPNQDPSTPSAITPTTFRVLKRLPPELRHMIWDFAIQPDRPDVHIFTLFNPEDEDEWEEMKDNVIAGIGGYHRGLAAPRLQADSSEPS